MQHLKQIQAMNYAFNCHASTNHLYDGQPYAVHLMMVVTIATKYIGLIPDVYNNREDIISACWMHDIIEDCRQTYNDVKKVSNENVADIVYALTNEKGKTRSERANDKYYEGIRHNPWATFVKLCDRIANVSYSKMTYSAMLSTYKKENKDFIDKLSPNPVYKPMVDELNCLFD